MDRRRFLKNAAVGIATAGLKMEGFSKSWITNQGEIKFIHRTLGRTGLEIPVVSFGVMNSDSPDLIYYALDRGIKHLDTAFLYLRGNSERVIGEVVQRRGERDKVIISTKMRFNRDREKRVFLLEGVENQPAATPENLYAQLDVSLKRLRTDYVDILYLHSCYSPAMATYEPLMNALVQVKKQGKARFIGVSTHHDEPNVIRAAVDAGIYDVVQTAYNYVQDHRDHVKEAILYAAQKGVGVVAMKTQGGASLQQEGQIKIDHTAALKWVIQDENVCTAIPGMTTYKQLDQNLRTMNDLALTMEEKTSLNESRKFAESLFCQNCRSCIETCPQRIEIPNIVRAYMYAYGYKNIIQAKDTIMELPEEKGIQICRQCPSCSAHCSHGIDIQMRINTLIKKNGLHLSIL